MVDTVRPRANHYETLGLTPAATGEEIARAFARELRRPRPFGGLTQVGIAHETLRDPARRKAYDRSIGIFPEPAPTQWKVGAVRWSGTPLSATAMKFSAAQPAAVPTPARAERAESAEPKPEPRTAPFIAAALREPVQPDPYVEVSRTPPPLLEPRPSPEPAFDAAEPGAIEWRRIGIAGGGLVAAVALVGAWAGWEAGNDIDSPAPAPAVTLAVPPANAVAAEAPELTPPAAGARSGPQVRAVARAGRSTTAAPPKPALPRPVELTSAEEQELASSPFVESVAGQVQGAEQAIAQAAAESQPARPVAASMPLPDRVVASTIRRIGYPCGAVTSTTAMESAGVFKVTCTSGHSYRAQPVRGRYRFKRL